MNTQAVLTCLVTIAVLGLVAPPQSLGQDDTLFPEGIAGMLKHKDEAGTTDADVLRLKILQTLRTTPTLADWKKAKQSADVAYKAEHYQESLKLYLKAKALASRMDAAKIPDLEKAEFLYSLMANYAEVGLYSKAKAGLEDFLGDDLKADDSISPELTIQVLNSLAEIDILQGNFQNAQSRLDKAVQIAKDKQFLTADTLKSLNLLGNLKWNQTKLAECDKYYSEVVALADKLGADGKEAMGKALAGRANVCRFSGRMKEARELAERSLARRKEVFSEESLESASSMLTLARVEGRGNTSAAQQLRLKALAIQVKLIGTSAHPTIAGTLLDLAGPPFDEPCSEAEYCCQTAKHAVDGTLGSSSPFVVHALSSLGIAYSREGKYKLARDVFKSCIEKETALYGARSVDVALTMQSLAIAAESDAWGRHQALLDAKVSDLPREVACPEGEALIKQAIEITDEVLAPGSAVAASMLGTQAWITKSAGDYAASEILAKKSLEILERCYGAGDNAVYSVRLTLLQDYTKEKKTAEAKELLSVMLKIQISQTGLYSKETGALLRKFPGLGNSLLWLEPLGLMDAEYTGLGATMEAIRLQLENADGHRKTAAEFAQAQESLSNSEKQYGDDSPWITYNLLKLAQLYVDEKKFSEAEPMYKRALAIQENGLGSDHPGLIKVLSDYSYLLQSMGKTKESDEMSARRSAILAAVKK